jgi:hypothetical protein
MAEGMRIEQAVYQSGCLVLQTSSPVARRFTYNFKPGEYELVKARNKRSLDANAYAWVLIDKIAAAVRLPKVEVYRNAIKGIGGVSEIVCVRNDAVEQFRRRWEEHGIGYQTETMPSKIAGCTNVVVYWGSSSYTRQQMSVFIDRLVEDARSLGIETMPPDRLEGLLNGW